MYSVMWSEHCSYKSSRMPPQAPARPRRRGCWSARARTPGSSTSATASPPPSASRATTTRRRSSRTRARPPGVGGILRDIFTMGARPIALMDPLRFGPLDDARSRWIAEGVVSGDLRLRQLGRRADRRRRGRLRRDLPRQPARQRAVPRRAARPTGSCSARRRASATSPCCSARPPAATASAACRCSRRPGSATTRPTPPSGPSVQVGDPFEEKRLIEACLAPARRRARRRHPGPRRRRAHVRDERDGEPRRRRHGRRRLAPCPGASRGMEPFEVMTSESQERMLAIVEPGGPRRGAARICARWEVRADGHRHGAPSGGRAPHPRRPGRATVLADVPAASLHEDAPLYDRPLRRPPTGRGERRPGRRCPARDDVGADLLAMLCRHVVGVAAVRPPAVPQHRRRARAATPRCCASSTPSPASTPVAGWRSPPTATTAGAPSTPRPGTALGRGRVGAQPGVRRGPAARAGQLPQLRQPRAPRGDVAAVGGDRRDGRGLPRLRHPGGRRQRQPLQREPRRATSTPRRSSACSAWSTTSAAGRPASGWSRAASCCWSGPAATRAVAGRLPLGLGSRGARRPPRCLRRRRSPRRLRLRPVARRRLASPLGVHDVSVGGLGAALAEPAVAGNERCRVDAGVDPPPLRGVAVPGRPVRRAGATRSAVVERADARRRARAPASVAPAATVHRRRPRRRRARRPRRGLGDCIPFAFQVAAAH